MANPSERHLTTALPGAPPGWLAVALPAGAAAPPARDAVATLLRSEIEAWASEGGAGDDPAP